MELQPYKRNAAHGFLPRLQHCETENLVSRAQRVKDLCLLKVITFYCAAFVALFGIVSNFLIIFTLSKRQASASAILYQALAIFDNVFLITAPNFIVPPTWPVKLVVGSTKKIAIHILLLLTIERFLVVRNPLRENWFTVKRTVIVLVKVVVTWMVVVFLTTTTFPERWSPHNYGYRMHSGMMRFVRFHGLPYRYTAVFEWIVEFLVPWPLLLGLNLKIIILVRSAVRKRNKFSAKDQKTDTSTAKCLVTVVFCYLILEACRNMGSLFLPAAMKTTSSSTATDGGRFGGSARGTSTVWAVVRNLTSFMKISYAYFTMVYVGNVLSMLNSSIDLYIYVLTGSKFRQMLIRRVKSVRLKLSYSTK